MALKDWNLTEKNNTGNEYKSKKGEIIVVRKERGIYSVRVYQEKNKFFTRIFKSRPKPPHSQKLT